MSTCLLCLLSCIRVIALPLRITLPVYIAELWIYCNIDFPPAKDNSLFESYPTAWETFGLMSIQEGCQTERAVSWWHQGSASVELLAGSRFHLQAQDMMQRDSGVMDCRACGAWKRTKSLETWQFILCLYIPFTLSRQHWEGQTSL